MAKKGVLEEIFSKAKFSDNPDSYKIIYRDFEKLKALPFSKFIMISDNFETIPSSRIEFVKKDKKIIYKRFKKRSK